ncbi:MAG: AMP-binding protein [Acidobacteria bacterium]|nr:AMP-binding protein [Acidobacteriota bacterium]
MPRPHAIGSPAEVEQRLLLLLQGFLAELGSRHAASALALGSSLDRDLALGSLERVELLSRLESEFGISLPDATIAEAETVEDLLRAIFQAEGRPAPEQFEVSPVLLSYPLPSLESAANLLEALHIHSQVNPQRPHVYLRQEDGSEFTITYGELEARAAVTARELERRGIGPGDRVALMLPTGADFFYCFMGVLLARAIPVPIYPPFRADRIEEFAARQSAILRNAEAARLITVGAEEGLAHLLRPRVPSLAGVISAEELSRGAAAPGVGATHPAIPRGGEAPALIQYTSGSTGHPKGVLLSHANLLANIRAIGKTVEIQPHDVGVSWLPLYHDMGLIGCWLLPLYYGIPIVILSPLAFLSRPERWLWAIHYHRATLSVGPNFAYDLCARKIREEAIEGLDLSSWRAALNGSESVRPETIARFTARFARYGFRPEAMRPVYGLAESALAVSLSPFGRTPRVDRIDREVFETTGCAELASGGRPALTYVSVGHPLPGHEVRIVDESGRLKGEREEGRLEFRGPSSMAGYFRQPEATAAITHGTWLDSGDLAYWADGELFVTGRSKDTILKTGRNLYPEEIEEAVAEVAGVRRGCVAAFGVADAEQGTEKLVVVAETRQQDAAQRDRIAAEIRSRIVELLNLPADEVILLSPGALPKTSSGKLRRAACRQAYQQGKLEARRPSAVAQWIRLALGWAPFALRHAAERAGRWLYAAYVYPLLGFCAVACWLTLLVLPGGRREQALRLFTRLFLRLAGVRIAVEGPENLGPGPLVFISNHASYIDALVLIAVLPRPFLFVAKQELLSTPVLRTFIRKLGYLAVERRRMAQSAAGAERLVEGLQAGRSLLVFAEGTFTRARGLRPFRLGAFQAAAQTGCPIVPLAIQGSRHVLPDECWLPRWAPIKVTIRPPIDPAGTGWRELIRLRDAAFQEILAHCGEPPLEDVPVLP